MVLGFLGCIIGVLLYFGRCRGFSGIGSRSVFLRVTFDWPA